MGSRAWISLWERGTFSLDTERGTWRMEGPWELPLKGRGLFVPELGCVIGIARGLKLEHSLHKERCCQVCALDVEARPPAVRRVWEIPPERVEEVAPSETVDPAYLGGGRFCVSRSVVVEVRTVEGWSCTEKGTSFTLLDVRRLHGGDLELALHGKAHSHVWPCGHIGHASFRQPA
ncbi:hypothetical protein C2845_PM11G13750 [Panicum miliaceum]|uniref:Uncharacterized protein n=1 Tax=Panicum miliaceum TaxID=4540 RepID=A0A3L6RR31_PANMI|nr:hypothetical protein C2845_PM11G13750 [Panicum miliaceum]